MNHGSRHISQRGGIVLALVILLIPILPLAVFVLFPDFINQHVPFFEKRVPRIEFTTKPEALGLGKNQIELQVSDDGAGIDEIVVRAEQQGRSYELFRKSFPRPKPLQHTFTIAMAPKELGLREDGVRLTAAVFDGSFWSNGAESQFSSRVIYSKPRVEVLTSQHNVVQGGAGLVFYRVLSGEIRESGIRIGEREFVGFPASALGNEFKSDPKVHFAFFAVPENFKSPPEKMVIFARDVGNNEAVAPMYFRVRTVSLRSANIKLSKPFLLEKVPDLLPKLYSESKQEQSIDPTTNDDKALATAFRMINEDLRKLNEQRIRAAVKSSARERLWTGVFSRSVQGSPTSSYGEQRTYTLDGREVSRSTHDGIDLAAVANTVITASNNGFVVFADDLGIYGNTVILDHGLGLSSLYGHLSSIAVSVGDRVNQGDQLGRSGMTGLAGGDHLHFELRIQGDPVTPIEWWDGRWIRDHIEDRITGMAGGTEASE